ncbi:MAG TPA: hypothetical protein PKV73_17660 [Agriterribacter sp.]|nr:hypothetical protein [Chitinophagaceae bacterium]HRP33730.1 hypothetical protein [Agriterribacter sp.]
MNLQFPLTFIDSTRRGGLFVYLYLLPPALQGAIHGSALRAKIKDPAHQNIN